MVKISNFSERANDSLTYSALTNEKGVLTKESSKTEIENYFKVILQLSMAKDEFPINLNDVWALVYNQKSDAVSVLRRKFIQDIDYKVLRQNPQNPQGGRPADEYFMSLSCLEFFIARKVRDVFEVYRKVFHSAVSMIENSSTTSDAIAWISFVGKELGLNDTSKLLLMKQWGDSRGLPTPDYVECKDIFLSATELLKRNNVNVSARVFNVAMTEKGLIEKKSRPSSKGQKFFNHLTDKGQMYGENQVSPNNPKETQPLYYESKFMELLTVIGLK